MLAHDAQSTLAIPAGPLIMATIAAWGLVGRRNGWVGSGVAVSDSIFGRASVIVQIARMSIAIRDKLVVGENKKRI